MTNNPAIKKLSSVNIFLFANSEMLSFSSYIDFCSYSSHLHLRIVTFKCFMKQTNKKPTCLSVMSNHFSFSTILSLEFHCN